MCLFGSQVESRGSASDPIIQPQQAVIEIHRQTFSEIPLNLQYFTPLNADESSRLGHRPHADRRSGKNQPRRNQHTQANHQSKVSCLGSVPGDKETDRRTHNADGPLNGAQWRAGQHGGQGACHHKHPRPYWYPGDFCHAYESILFIDLVWLRLSRYLCPGRWSAPSFNGAGRARTANPRVANAVLSQLSYGPPGWCGRSYPISGPSSSIVTDAPAASDPNSRESHSTGYWDRHIQWLLDSLNRLGRSDVCLS